MKDDNEESFNSPNEEKSSQSQCGICGQKFRFLKALRKHELRHQGAGGFICRTCGMAFTSSSARERHRDKDHKILRCRLCNIKFNTEPEYLHHINSLHDGRDRELFMCSECGKQFKTKGELANHVNSKCGTVKPFKCNICEQSLMNAGSLINHMLRHSTKRIYMCNFCAKTFITAGQLTVHERAHTQEKAYVCNVCNKGFCHRQSLITHSTLHTGIRPFQCEGCGKAFSCIGNLLKHRKTHKDTCAKIELTSHRVQNPTTRMKVQANTPASTKLKKQAMQKKIKQAVEIVASLQHENSDNSSSNHSDYNPGDNKNLCQPEDVSNEVKNEIQNNALPINVTMNNASIERYVPNIETKSTCVHNEAVNTKNDDMLKNKVEDNNDQNKIQEEISDDKDSDWRYDSDSNDNSDDSIDLFTRKLNSGMNIEDKFSENKTICKKSKTNRTRVADRNKLKKFLSERYEDGEGATCKYCGSLYTNVGWLLRHEKKCAVEQKTKGIKCSCCASVFENKDDCVNHQYSHHADILTCKECNKIFANPDSVKAHMNFYHKGVPRKVYMYVCNICGKVFKQKAMLLTHEQNNCGEGPMFSCSMCEKSFTSKYVLKSHMKVHESEKTLLCKFCGKSFHWKGQLKIHERSHTGEKPFKCSQCPKSFSYRESLVTHSTLHTGIKPHLCVVCGSRFSCIGNLLKHRRTHAATCGVVSKVKAQDSIST